MVKPKKHLGQHFLRSDSIAGRIAAALPVAGCASVLEIGPGTGILTRSLLAREDMPPLYAAEIDAESIRYLADHIPALQGHLLPGDFLQLRLEDHLPLPLALIGNYPYNISSQIVFKMLEQRAHIPVMTGMFQREVARRLTAPPGSRTYGILSVLCDAYYERDYLFEVPPEAFRPPPKVHSAVICMRRKPEPELPCTEAQLRRVVKAGFNQRRKTLRNALKSLQLPYEARHETLLQKRAEQLHFSEFADIASLLS